MTDKLALIDIIYSDNAEGWASLIEAPPIRYTDGPTGPRAVRRPSASVMMASDREIEPLVLDRFEEPWQVEPGEVAAGPITKILRQEIRHKGRPSHWKYTARREWAVEESLLVLAG